MCHLCLILSRKSFLYISLSIQWTKFDTFAYLLGALYAFGSRLVKEHIRCILSRSYLWWRISVNFDRELTLVLLSCLVFPMKAYTIFYCALFLSLFYLWISRLFVRLEHVGIHVKVLVPLEAWSLYYKIGQAEKGKQENYSPWHHYCRRLSHSFSLKRWLILFANLLDCELAHELSIVSPPPPKKSEE